MAEQRTYKGHVYTRGGPGEQWAMQGPASTAMPSVIQLPESPRQQRQDEHQRAADQRAADAARRAADADDRAKIVFRGKYNDDGSPKINTPAALGDTTKTGGAYLASLPPAMRARVQQLLDGRSMLSSREKGQPLGQQLLDAANQADPNFDETASHARYTARQQFTGMGKGSLAVQAAERLAQHVNDLYTASAGLTGPDLGFAPLSNLATGVGQSFQQAAVNRYKTILPLIAGELQKLTKNGSATVDESKHIMDSLAPNQPAASRLAAIQEVVKLGEAQMEPSRQAWASAWNGATPPPMPMDFNPATQAIFDNINQGGKPLEIDHRTGAVVNATGGTPGSGSGPGIGPPSNGPAAPNVWDTTGQGGPGTLATAGASEKRVDVPPEMQAEYEAYVAKNRGRLDPSDYVAFRQDQARRYGFGMNDAKVLHDEALRLNDEVAKGIPLNLRIPGGTSKLTGLDQFNAGLFNNSFGAAVLGAGSLAGGADEVAGGFNSLLHGTSYTVERDKADAIRQSMSDAHPMATIAGNLAGTAAGAYALGGALPGAAAAMADYAPVSGAAYGAISGALENNDHRAFGATLGAGLGAAGGAAGKYLIAPVAERLGRTSVAQGLVRGIDSAANRVRPNPVARALVPQLDRTESSVLRMSPDMAGVRQNLSDAADHNLPYSLADADPKLRMLAGAVARKSPVARALAETTFNPRGLGQADRAITAIDQNLAPVTNIAERGKQLLQAGNQAASPSYNLARGRAAPVDPEIGAMLETPAGKQALINARAIAANEGRDANGIGFDLDAQGNVTLASNPSFETLQYAKRGLDQVLNGHRDQFGKLDLQGNPLAQSINDLRSRFNARLGALNPDYAAGNAEWSQWAKRRDALDLGYSVLPKGTVPQRDFEAAVGGMNDHTLPEAQRGYATAMADKADSVRATSNPYEQIYGSPQQQGKVATMFPEGAPAFDRVYNLEGDMAKTRFETLGGSSTAGRIAADQSIGGDLAVEAADAGSQLMTGGGVPAGTLIRSAARLGLGKAGEQRAADIAKVLFDTTDPRAMMTAMGQLDEKMAAIAKRQADYQKIVGLLTAGAAVTPVRP